ncbi:MAG TPA: peptidoglycan bridge formation glycyltransferase FemA/FemB family protein [Chloroflexota bacterium]|nr:peptidoglycan bridge formation glycyltransferase FemA/FemB family protein [Chloroflexota bacterium]
MTVDIAAAARPLFTLGLPDEGWDERQKARSAHFLQGFAWARFQSALGRRAAHSESDAWSWAGYLTLSRGIRHLYLPYGPTLAERSALPFALESADAAARALRADFLRCEPIGATEAALEGLGLRRVADVQPEATSIVDLSLSVEELRRRVSSGHRNAINRAGSRGIKIALTSDPSSLDSFLHLMSATTRMRDFRTHPRSYFETLLRSSGQNVVLGLAGVEDRPIAGTLCFDGGDTRAYLFAASDPVARKIQAAVPLVWETMMDARRQGRTRYDLWGVAPRSTGPDHPWSGFSQFKRSFGGIEVEYGGTWELPVRPIRYALYTGAKRMARSLRLGIS